ncbi:MAG TPA: hypothetical protein VFD00_11765 [Thermoclostridium sp.]|nr:hypothetical protein [Thermoclostridium sp.]
MSQFIDRQKHFTSIILCVVILYFISMYWVLSGTLLNPVFYNEVLTNKNVSSLLSDTPQILSDNTIFSMSANTITNNILSLIDGLIRYITQNDMTLADINFESIITPLNDEVFTEISRIHPYAITYFVPDSNNIYQYLYLLQQGYAIYRFISPFLYFIGLLIILFSKKACKILRTVIIISSLAICLTGLLLLVFKEPLFTVPISNALGINSLLVKPFIQKICTSFFIRTLQLSLLYITIALVTKIQAVEKAIEGNSKNIALIIFVSAVLFSVLFKSEISNNLTNAVYSNIQAYEIYTLDKEEGAVHSLNIKLKDEQTDKPIPNVQITLIKSDFSDRFVSFSDKLGNVHFIISQGDFFLYANQSTVPEGLVSFEPVIISINNPDSSWYTFHLRKSNNTSVNPETQSQQIFETSDLLAP